VFLRVADGSTVLRNSVHRFSCRTFQVNTFLFSNLQVSTLAGGFLTLLSVLFHSQQTAVTHLKINFSMAL
jgi:hypothetical protein